MHHSLLEEVALLGQLVKLVWTVNLRPNSLFSV